MHEHSDGRREVLSGPHYETDTKANWLGMAIENMINPEVLSQKNQISIVRPAVNQWQVLKDLKMRSIIQDHIAFADPIPERTKYEQREQGEWEAILSGKMSGGRNGESITLFVRDGTEYIGMVSAIIPEQQGEEKTATIQHMFVDENYRGKGIGEDLLLALIQQLKQKSDVTKAQLDVVVTQRAAIGLYKKLGFQTTGYTSEKAQRGDKEYDGFNMTLRLKSF